MGRKQRKERTREDLLAEIERADFSLSLPAIVCLVLALLCLVLQMFLTAYNYLL